MSVLSPERQAKLEKVVGVLEGIFDANVEVVFEEYGGGDIRIRARVKTKPGKTLRVDLNPETLEPYGMRHNGEPVDFS